MKLNLTDIEQAAQAATPGPWRWNGNGEMVGPRRADLIDSEYDYDNPPPWMDGDHCPIIIQTDSGQYPPHKADARHIATANPTTVLAMVARIRQLETALVEACSMADAYAAKWHGDLCYLESLESTAEYETAMDRTAIGKISAQHDIDKIASLRAIAGGEK